MIQEDAQRLLALIASLKALDVKISQQLENSVYA
jgi:hypothetical protein